MDVKCKGGHHLMPFFSLYRTFISFAALLRLWVSSRMAAYISSGKKRFAVCMNLSASLCPIFLSFLKTWGTPASVRRIFLPHEYAGVLGCKTLKRIFLYVPFSWALPHLLKVSSANGVGNLGRLTIEKAGQCRLFSSHLALLCPASCYRAIDHFYQSILPVKVQYQNLPWIFRL